MKRITSILFFTGFSLIVGSSEPKPMDYITFENNVEILMENARKTEFEKLLAAVRFTESSNNDFAVGSSEDWGPLQITPIRLEDFNQRTGKNYSHKDCFKWEVSKEIFIYYASRIGINKNNFEEICRRWNRWNNWKDNKGLNYWNRVQSNLV